MDKALGLGVAVLKGILSRAAGLVWEDLWKQVLSYVAEAEWKWKLGQLQEKKRWVVEQTIGWLSQKVKISGIQKWLLSVILGYVVDAVVGELNEILGHNWVSKVEDVKEDIEVLIPWLPNSSPSLG